MASNSTLCANNVSSNTANINSLSYKQPVVALTAATTISVQDSGTLFTLDSAAGAYTVTLPTVASGANCIFTFVVAENTPTADITISSNNEFNISLRTIKSGTPKTLLSKSHKTP